MSRHEATGKGVCQARGQFAPRRAPFCRLFPTPNRGAALIVAIAVLTILLAIALTFFTVTRLGMKTATNVENTVQADNLNIGAVNIAIDFLKRDAVAHPTYTSLDHAWRTFFNGAWVVGKQWAYPDRNTYPNLLTFMTRKAPQVPVSYLYPRIFFVPELNQTNTNQLLGGGSFGDALYIPRGNLFVANDPYLGHATNAADYLQFYNQANDPYLFVTDPMGILDPTDNPTNPQKPKLTVAQQIDQWADVDNDGDGLKDSVWIPLAADHDFGTVTDDEGNVVTPGDGADNDLDGNIDFSQQTTWTANPDGTWQQLPPTTIPEVAAFLYNGAADGFDNDGDGVIDDANENRWYLTAPINEPDGSYVVLQKVSIPGIGNVNINTSPDIAWVKGANWYTGRWVDVLDNNYDLTINNHSEYFTPNPQWEASLRTQGQTYYQAVIDAMNATFSNNGFTWLHAWPNWNHEFDNLTGVHEINPAYLDLSKSYPITIKDPATGNSVQQPPSGTPGWWRIKSTGEPVSDLVGRAAIMINDESSKVNLNVAGGHYLDVPGIVGYEHGNGPLPPGPVVPPFYTDPSDMDHFYPSVNSGATTSEYCTFVLPDVGPARSTKLWNLLTGAPNGGLFFGSPTASFPKGGDEVGVPTGADNMLHGGVPEYVPDVVLPGNGFADDDANALALAMNGIDDNGNGLVDEGVNDGTNLTPEQVEAAVGFANQNGWIDSHGNSTIPSFTIGPTDSDTAKSVYQQFLGRYFEGIDEPGELRQYRPYRDTTAENDPNVRDENGNANLTGRYGDHILKTREEIKRVLSDEGSWNAETGYVPMQYPTADNFFNDMSNLISLHSSDNNNRVAHETINPDGTITAVPQPQAMTGLKLDYNFAPPKEIADALQSDWDAGMKPLSLYPPGVSSNDAGTLRELSFLDGLKQEGVTVRTDNYVIPNTTIPLNAPVDIPDPSNPNTNTLPFFADAYLRWLRLGCLINDSRKTDFTRTTATAQIDIDSWWHYLQTDPSPNGAGLSAAQDRPIKYTVSGLGGLRITEMMVRPVRRVEAEMEMTTDTPVHLKLNPNLFPHFQGQPVPDFYMVRNQMQDLVSTLITNSQGVYVFGDSGASSDANFYWPFLPFPTAQDFWNSSLGPHTVRYCTEYRIPVSVVVPNSSITPTALFPNIMEFVFKPGPGLPPGKYHLTINTSKDFTDSTGTVIFNKATVNDQKKSQIRVAVKYVHNPSGANSTLKCRSDSVVPPTPLPQPMTVGVQSITQDVMDRIGAILALDTSPAGSLTTLADDVSNFYNSPYWTYYWRSPADANVSDNIGPIVGYEDMSNPDTSRATGWIFVPTVQDNPAWRPAALSTDNTLAGYGQDQAFTVTIPYYNPTDQVELHVAVCMGEDAPFMPATMPANTLPTLAINFFDFSQEPEQEWLEIENVSGRTIDFSKNTFQVTVGGVDKDGNVTPGLDANGLPRDDTVVLQIPPYKVDGVTPLVLGTTPGANRLLLAVKAMDFLENASPPAYAQDAGFTNLHGNLLFNDGIGQIGSSDPTSLLYDVSVPMIPMRDAANPTALGGWGGFLPAAVTAANPDPTVFDQPSPANLAAYPGNPLNQYIVQAIIVKPPKGCSFTPPIAPRVQPILSATNPYDIGTWVLHGGLFPNYPEHDGVDNDNDNAILAQDGVDHNGFGAPNKPLEGVDEGRYFIDSEMYVAANAPPGGFSMRPVAYRASFFDATGTQIIGAFDSTNTAITIPMPWLSDPSAPPEWKSFVERRSFPGDNVVISIFQGDAKDRKVVDRVTYNERDVINRAIDDVHPVFTPDGSTQIRQQLGYPFNSYMTFWPDNSMEFDFYRSLECKHSPYYPGDRFGTSDRWEATDGNYDDWSHDPVRTFDATSGNWVEDLVKYNGTPLTDNAAYDVNNESPASFSQTLRAALVTTPGGTAYDDFIADRLTRLQTANDQLNMRRTPFVSAGGLMTLPYVSIEETYSYDTGTGSFLYDHSGNAAEKARAENRIRNFDGLGLNQDFWTDPELDSQVSNNYIPGFQRNVIKQIRHNLPALTASSAFSPVRLGCGTASFYPLDSGVTPTTSITAANINWGAATTPWIPPQIWSPLLLYPLTAPPGGTESPPNVLPYSLLDVNHFLFQQPTLPAAVTVMDSNTHNDLLSRWPYAKRVNMCVAENTTTTSSGSPSPLSAALFVWAPNAGIENGQYDLYLDTGRLTPFQTADNNYLLANGQHLLTPVGVQLANDPTTPDQMLFDVEVFTDNNGDGALWAPGPAPSLLVPQNASPIPSGNFQRGSASKRSDSLGKVGGLQPTEDGYVHYGTVQVQNHYLAVLIWNESLPGALNRFCGVILAPSAGTPGKINVNTAETRIPTVNTRNFANNTIHSSQAVFNALMGIPGLLLNPGQTLDSQSATLPALIPFSVAPAPLGWDWSALPTPDFTPPVPSDPNYELKQERAMLERARLIEVGRSVWPDGRYYKFVTDMASDANLSPLQTLNLYPLSSAPPAPVPITTPTGIYNDLVAHPALDATGTPIVFDKPVNEANWRLDRSANLMTTHSDVFEILVTVQAGYGTDLNGDGIIDYRGKDPNNQEFVVTSEKKTRTIYQR